MYGEGSSSSDGRNGASIDRTSTLFVCSSYMIYVKLSPAYKARPRNRPILMFVDGNCAGPYMYLILCQNVYLYGEMSTTLPVNNSAGVRNRSSA